MGTSRVIQYRTKPEWAEENQRLVQAVFAELADAHPDGLDYATYRLADGVSFVHIVTTESDTNPLLTTAAFHEFQAGIGERCEQGPTPSDASKVGSYSG
jgi:hypothetical protein